MNSNIMRKSLYLFAVPALIFYLILWIFPILRLFQYSISDYNGYAQDFNYIGFENYTSLINGDLLMVAIENTLIYTVASVSLSVVVGLGLALLLNMKIRGKGLYRSLAYIPTLFSAIVVGFLWTYVYMPDYGMIATLLEKLGIHSQFNFLGNYSTALYAIIIVEIWKNIGTTMIIFLAALQTVPNELLESGRIDGCGPIRLFFKIKLPLLATAMTINVTLSIINGLKAFDFPFIMTNGGPGTSTNTLIFAIYKMAFTEQLFGKASALGVLSFGMIILITSIFVVRMNKREVSA